MHFLYQLYRRKSVCNVQLNQTFHKEIMMSLQWIWLAYCYSWKCWTSKAHHNQWVGYFTSLNYWYSCHFWTLWVNHKSSQWETISGSAVSTLAIIMVLYMTSMPHAPIELIVREGNRLSISFTMNAWSYEWLLISVTETFWVWVMGPQSWHHKNFFCVHACFIVVEMESLCWFLLEVYIKAVNQMWCLQWFQLYSIKFAGNIRFY